MPWSITSRILILLAGASIAFAAGWSVNGWRLGEQMVEKERDRIAAVAAQNEAHRLKERVMTKQAEEARNAATQRETVLRRAADGARGAADGMRDQLADLRRRLPGLTDDAVRLRASTLADLLNQCTTEYRALAEIADRLGSDRQTLIEAWPK